MTYVARPSSNESSAMYTRPVSDLFVCSGSACSFDCVGLTPTRLYMFSYPRFSTGVCLHVPLLPQSHMPTTTTTTAASACQPHLPLHASSLSPSADISIPHPPFLAHSSLTGQRRGHFTHLTHFQAVHTDQAHYFMFFLLYAP